MESLKENARLVWGYHFVMIIVWGINSSINEIAW